MKNISLMFGFMLCFIVAEEFIIDRTRAVIYNQAQTIVITQADLQKPSVTGEPKDLKMLCFEYFVMLQAQAINLPKPDVSDILRQVDEASIKQAGYTVEEFQEEVVRYQTLSSMLDFKVYSKVVVSQEAIIDFFNNNPELTEPRYYVKRAVLDKKEFSKEAVIKIIRTKKDFIEWQEPFWIAEKEIAADKLFLTQMPVHKIKIVENQSSFELYTVIAKEERQVTPLEVRYQKIVIELKQPLVRKLFEQYQAEIFDQASYRIYE